MLCLVGMFFGCYGRISVGWVVFSDVVRGISVTHNIGVGHMEQLVFSKALGMVLAITLRVSGVQS